MAGRSEGHADEAQGAINWHRLLGLYWIDVSTGLPMVVEVEKDLSVQQQLLDVLILRRGRGRIPLRLPDGFDNLARHNLITFKSFQEALDDWALKELTGHYVAYRKLVSPSLKDLLPEDEFRLYAVCSRFPHNLANTLAFQAVQEGVYEVQRGTDVIRVIVLRQLPKEEHNAMLLLFSGSQELVSYGAEHYHQRSGNTSSLLEKVLTRYASEGVTMSYTMQDFQRDYTKSHLKDLTLKERLEGVSDDELMEVVKELPANKRLEVIKDLPANQRLEAIKDLPANQRLEAIKDLPAEQIEKFLEQREKHMAGRKRKPRA